MGARLAEQEMLVDKSQHCSCRNNSVSGEKRTKSHRKTSAFLVHIKVTMITFSLNYVLIITPANVHSMEPCVPLRCSKPAVQIVTQFVWVWKR